MKASATDRGERERERERDAASLLSICEDRGGIPTFLHRKGGEGAL